MDVSAPTITQSPATSTAATTPTAEETAGLSSDFETFLRMLTAQIRNQDPLNPMEASDFAVQLATFSGVEQQVRTNDLLGSIADRLDLDTLGRLSGWVGMEALVAGDVALAGAPVDVAVPPVAGADRAELRITDSAGTIVARFPVSPGGQSFVWDGTDGAGTPLAAGQYALTVQAYSGAEALPPVTAAAYQLVTEIQSVDGEASLVLAGGSTVAADMVSALRAPKP